MNRYESYGRTNQKKRTREALINAATDMVRQGLTPTVGEVADAALISRSTAYRYFPSQELLLTEVALDELIRPELDAVYEISRQPGTTSERLANTIAADMAMQMQHETVIRTALRVWLARDVGHDTTTVRRPGNRLRYIANALEDEQCRLGERRFRKLVLAMIMFTGIESVIQLMDIAGLTREEALEVKQWASAALLQAALQESEHEG